MRSGLTDVSVSRASSDHLSSALATRLSASASLRRPSVSSVLFFCSICCFCWSRFLALVTWASDLLPLALELSQPIRDGGPNEPVGHQGAHHQDGRPGRSCVRVSTDPWLFRALEI